MYIRLYIKIIRNFGSSDRIGSSDPTIRVHPRYYNSFRRNLYIMKSNVEFVVDYVRGSRSGSA